MDGEGDAEEFDPIDARRDIFRLYEAGLLDADAATAQLLALDRAHRRKDLTSPSLGTTPADVLGMLLFRQGESAD